MIAENKVIVFGASKGGEKTICWLQKLGYEIVICVDNNKEKWGSTCNGILVQSPQSIMSYSNGIIVIASVYQEAIITQLLSYKINPKRIYSREEILFWFLMSHISDFDEVCNLEKNNKHSHTNIIYEVGADFSGINTLNYTILSELCNRKIEYNLICKKVPSNKEFYLNEMKKNSKSFFIHEDILIYDIELYINEIKNIILYLKKFIPCKIFLNFLLYTPVTFAAFILKYYYKEKIQINVFLHSARKERYIHTFRVQKYVENFLCTSQVILNTLKEKYKISEYMLSYKENPIFVEKDYKKKYNINEPLRITYAARLEKLYKRADLIPKLISECEKINLKYNMKIAGIGSMYQFLEDYILQNNLSSKIILCGLLNREEMKELWKETDIFINLSDCESQCLSLAESMSYNVVPVVSHVESMDEFLIDGKNSELIPLFSGNYGLECNVKIMSEKLKKIDENRELLYIYGNNCRKIILNKCSIDSYMDYFIDKFILNEK